MSLGALAEIWAEAMRGLGAADRVFALMDRMPGMPLTGGDRPPWCEGHLSFEGVRFAYPTRPEAEVLAGIDLDLAQGEVVALVGASGAGKSTIAALVGRLYDPTAGRVLLDGRDLRELDPAWLREQIGVVPQEPILFSASIERERPLRAPERLARRGRRRLPGGARGRVRPGLPRRLRGRRSASAASSSRAASASASPSPARC